MTMIQRIFSPRAAAAAIAARPVARKAGSGSCNILTTLLRRCRACLNSRKQASGPAPNEKNPPATIVQCLPQHWPKVAPPPIQPSSPVSASPVPKTPEAAEVSSATQFTAQAVETLLAAGRDMDRIFTKDAWRHEPLATDAKRNMENFACLYCVAVEVKGETPALKKIGRDYVELLAENHGIGDTRLPYAAAYDMRLALQEKLLDAAGATRMASRDGWPLLKHVGQRAVRFIAANADGWVLPHGLTAARLCRR